LSVVYDPNGNVMSVSDGTELIASYSYDGVNRLVKAEGRLPIAITEGQDGEPESHHYADSYALDTEGNIVEFGRKIGADEHVVRYDYQSGGNQLRAAKLQDSTSDGSILTYQYDEAGNMIHLPNRRSYRWDHGNNLLRADKNGGTRVFLSYLLSGELVRKVIEVNGGHVVEEVVRFGEFERRRRINDEETTYEQHVALMSVGDLPLAVAERTVIGGDVPSSSSNIRFQLTDQLHSVLLELTSTSETVLARDYAAFGTMVGLGIDETPLAPRFGFRGLLFDRDLDLYQADGRWYDPELGRFIQPDNDSDDVTNAYLFNSGNPQRR
jgi:RHS repeat-associated protein